MFYIFLVKKPEDLFGKNGLLKQLTKLLVEKALDAELTEHLGHGTNEVVANASGKSRNGKSRNTLKGDFSHLPIEVPRDRQEGSFGLALPSIRVEISCAKTLPRPA